jgi:hypothetical protein
MAQVVAARQVVVAGSQTSVPEQVLPAAHGQPGWSALQAWQRPAWHCAVPSQAGAAARQGQLGAPATHALEVQTPAVQVSPVLQVSPGPHAQLASPAVQVWQTFAAQRRPVLQVPFERHAHARSPTRQSTHAPDTHEPVVHGWLSEQAQPMAPEQVPPSPVGAGLGQPASARRTGISSARRRSGSESMGGP